MKTNFCFYCPWCIERLADERDGAFDYPDMQLFCKSAKRVIVDRTRYCDIVSVPAPEWCPLRATKA